MPATSKSAAEQFKCLNINREEYYSKRTLYYLLTKYKHYNIVSFFSNLCFFSNLFCYYYFLNLIVYIRLLIARILSVLPENFRNWGSCRPPPPSPPARTPMLIEPLFTQVYKWVPANLLLGVTLRLTSILTRGCRDS